MYETRDVSFFMPRKNVSRKVKPQGLQGFKPKKEAGAGGFGGGRGGARGGFGGGGFRGGGRGGGRGAPRGAAAVVSEEAEVVIEQ